MDIESLVEAALNGGYPAASMADELMKAAIIAMMHDGGIESAPYTAAKLREWATEIENQARAEDRAPE
jgi:hypothetical protein